jgi:hypothetical protein
MKSDPSLDLIGRLPGQTGPLAVQGEYAYLTVPKGVRVADISNPAAPKVIGMCDELARPMGMDLASGYAYVIRRGGGLSVLGISDPKSPRVLGTCDKPANPWDVAVDGDYAFVTAGYGLSVLNISSAESPKFVGSWDLVGSGDPGTSGITIAGKLAYVSADYSGLYIMDITNPKNPKKVGLFEGPGNVTASAVMGNYAYVADYSGGMVVVDVSDPKAPKQVAEYGDCCVGSVAVSGNYVFVAAGTLDLLDVSNPAAPRLIESYEEPEEFEAWQVIVEGDCVYARGSGEVGLFILRLTSHPNRQH